MLYLMRLMNRDGDVSAKVKGDCDIIKVTGDCDIICQLIENG